MTPLLAAEVRGNFSARDHAKVRNHLTHCDGYGALYAELADLNHNLAALLAPAVLARPGPATWASTLR